MRSLIKCCKTRTDPFGLSNTPQGAGGVGGLLAVRASTPVPIDLFPAYDGNGNITAYVDVDGRAVATFSYDAFGQKIRSEFKQPRFESMCRYGFSTKHVEPITGWCYYGFRYYQPTTGQWLNRDPIGERGGLNLYGMVGNDPVNSVDALGRLKFNIGVGLGVSGTVLAPGAYGSVGFSITYSAYFAAAWDDSRTGDKLQCAICHTGAVTGMVGAGAAVNIGGGPVITFGPSGDINDQSGYAIQVGAGVGVPVTPGTVVGETIEYTVDVDIKTKQVTIMIPKAGLGITAYAAIRVTGSCTGCTGVLGSPTVRDSKLSDCLNNVAAALRDALDGLSKERASATGATNYIYKHLTDISPDSKSDE